MAVTHNRGFGARITATAFDAYCAFFRLFDVDRASAIGGRLLRTVGPMLRAHSVARTNLHLAFPDLSEEEERTLLAEMWDNLGRMVGEIPHLDLFTTDVGRTRIELVGAERLDALEERKTAAVLVGGHFANFEIIGLTIAQHGLPCQITYRPMNNGFVDDRFVALRHSYGVRSFAAKGRRGGMALLRALASGEAVGIMNDQKYNEGVPTTFFGREVMTADGPARLARRFGCPLVPMSVTRLKGAHFRVEVFDPIEQSELEDDTAAVTETAQRITAFIEDQVRAAPAQWFWVHRRWPSEIYRQRAARS